MPNRHPNPTVKTLEELYVACRFTRQRCEGCPFESHKLTPLNLKPIPDGAIQENCPIEIVLTNYKTGPTKGELDPWVEEHWEELQTLYKELM